MDIRTFHSFVVAAELMNITAAAKRLNLTQSALSRQIKGLEDYLGVKLFEKQGRSVRLTVRGEALFQRINGVLVADRNLRALAEDLSGGQAGELRVGACSQLIERYFPAFLKQWSVANPGVGIRLEDGGGAELAEKLKSGAVQLTVSAMPSVPVSHFEVTKLGQLGFLAVGAHDVLEASNQPIDIATLAGMPILALNKRHASREVFDAACRLTGHIPRLIMESYSPHTLFSLAEAGNGVAVVPSSARIASANLVKRPVSMNGELIRFDICAMWNTRSPLPVYGRFFIDALGAHIKAQELDGEPDNRLVRRGNLHLV